MKDTFDEYKLKITDIFKVLLGMFFQKKSKEELELIILKREEKTKSNFNLFSEMTHCYNFITSLKCHKIVSKAITKI